jgi:hypothetical protein
LCTGELPPRESSQRQSEEGEGGRRRREKGEAGGRRREEEDGGGRERVRERILSLLELDVCDCEQGNHLHVIHSEDSLRRVREGGGRRREEEGGGGRREEKGREGGEGRGEALLPKKIPRGEGGKKGREGRGRGGRRENLPKKIPCGP